MAGHSNGTGAKGTYAPLKTNNNNNNNDISKSAKGRTVCGWSLKVLGFLVLFVMVFLYTTRLFVSSKIGTNDEVLKSSWSLDVDSYRQTKIISDTEIYQTEQDTAHLQLNQSQSAKVPERPQVDLVIQGTGPHKNATGPRNVDGKDDQGMKQDNGNGEIRTIFSTLHSSFADLHIGENNKIPTKEFIVIGTDLRPLLDTLGSSVSLIEGDIKGNAKKIMKVYNDNVVECATVQDMVIFDIKRGKRNDNEASVVSLTWLKRAYEFIGRFMQYTVEGAEPLKAAYVAYDEVLSEHHNFFVRSAFKVGMNMLPSRQNFFRKLVVNEQDTQKPNCEEKVIRDTKNYLRSMRHVFDILRDFFEENNLDN